MDAAQGCLFRRHSRMPQVELCLLAWRSVMRVGRVHESQAANIHILNDCLDLTTLRIAGSPQCLWRYAVLYRAPPAFCGDSRSLLILLRTKLDKLGRSQNLATTDIQHQSRSGRLFIQQSNE